jgi:hypothetical protein
MKLSGKVRMKENHFEGSTDVKTGVSDSHVCKGRRNDAVQVAKCS